MRVVTAQPPEYVAAMQVLFQHLPPAEAFPRIRAALQLTHEPAARLLIARRDSALVGAVLAQVLPGSTGVLWPPCAATGVAHADRVEDALLHEALAWLRRQGAKLAQVILAASDSPLGEPLLRQGFTRTTQMHFLRRESVSTSSDGHYQTYLTADPAVFHDALLRSYRGSLDFPEVDGVRTLPEVLRGYQADGYDPKRWWLRCDADGPAGVLILTEVEPGAAWDLSYVGIVPEARRRGHGRALVCKALAEARAAGAAVLTLCVDGRNTPALELYRGLGFEEFDHRDVYLNLF